MLSSLLPELNEHGQVGTPPGPAELRPFPLLPCDLAGDRGTRSNGRPTDGGIRIGGGVRHQRASRRPQPHGDPTALVHAPARTVDVRQPHAHTIDAASETAQRELEATFGVGTEGVTQLGSLSTQLHVHLDLLPASVAAGPFRVARRSTIDNQIVWYRFSDFFELSCAPWNG